LRQAGLHPKIIGYEFTILLKEAEEMSVLIKDIHKNFGEKSVLSGISLDIGRQNFALLGPNGAGKTTLISIISGLIKADSGEVEVCGMSPKKHLQEIRQRIGLVTQETEVYEYLTAKENLEFHAKFYGVPATQVKPKVDEMLALAHLENRANDRVGTFSSGMKRRLALVRAMLHDPDILIFDEPTLGVDVQNRNEIWNRILELKGKKTIFINTNYMDEADRLSDICGIIDGGKLIALDTAENLKISDSRGILLTAMIEIDESKINDLAAKLKNYSKKAEIEKDRFSGLYHVQIPAHKKPNVLLTDIISIFGDVESLAIKDIQVKVPTLEDVFISLTGKNLRD
jgi:ABC-2 type transport system ATP-binding protein